MAGPVASAKDFDGAGDVWFKIHEIPAIADPNGVEYPKFPAEGLASVTFTIPKNVPTGQYVAICFCCLLNIS